MQWWILHVNLTGPQTVQIAGYIWFLDMSVRLFPENIGIWISRLSKAEDPLQWGWPPSNLLRAWTEQRKVNSLSAWWLSWNIDLLLPLELQVLRPSDPGWFLHHQVPGPVDFKLRHLLSWFLNLQIPDHGTSQSSWLHESIVSNKSLYMYILLALFLGRTLTNIFHSL